jgi:hypothetical protein
MKTGHYDLCGELECALARVDELESVIVEASMDPPMWMLRKLLKALSPRRMAEVPLGAFVRASRE